MGVMSVWHHDIIEFIAKQTPSRLSKFNISVNCTEDFMQKVTAVEYRDTSQDRMESEYFRYFFENYKAEWNGDLNLWKQRGILLLFTMLYKVSWLWNLIMEVHTIGMNPVYCSLIVANEYAPAELC